MNKYLLDYLISPETGDPLLLTNISENVLLCGQLKGNDPTDIFNIINEIPILLRHDQVADYNNNILDIIFKHRMNEIFNEIGEKHNWNYGLLKDELDKYILHQYGKEGIVRAYEEYSIIPENQRLSWYAKLDKDQVNE
ncbi:MAG: hypothetical protein K0S76_3 [Herbinix sp.]|jgi:uncharacterized protein YbaR (Trm112 family)|nr:hypothetical protein [Herbinix sp.]